MENRQNTEFYDFGAFRLDAKNRLLWHGDKLVALNVKEFDVLLFLVENAGRVVEKGDLLDAVWKDTFVEEGTLTQSISRLRKKLEAENPDHVKIIETLPKRGYCFRAQVSAIALPEFIIEEKKRTLVRVEETVQVADNESSDTQLIKAVNLQPETKLLNPRSAFRIPQLFWIVLAVAVVSVVAIAVYQIYFRQARTKNLIATRIAPFSGVLGRENYPAFSPDGRQLTFSWNGGDGDNLDIYVRLINTSEPVRLTDTESTEQHPTFSPDGTHIAFVRSLKTGGEVIIIPSLGGAERRVARLFSGFASVSFAPDGLSLAVIDTEDSTEGKQYAVYIVNVQTGERRRLNVSGDFAGETTPRFAPDGKHLAFVRVSADKTQDLFVASLDGNVEPRRITFDRKTIHSLSWSADGKEIFFVSFRGSNQTNIWRVGATGGEPELIATGSREITNLAVSPDGKTFAFVENTLNLDIWRAEKSLSAKNQPEKKFLGSTHNEFNPELSPDGSRVIFGSNRTSKNEIWMSDAAGKNLRQITDSEGSVAAPHFSPDGSSIVYHSVTNGNTDIFIVSSEGGAARRLTSDATEEKLPVWSMDGVWIYFTSNRTGENQIWKMSATGGEAIQITRQGAFQIVSELPDGNGILFTKTNNTPAWRMSANGEEQIVPILSELASASFLGNWSATRRGLYFLTRDSNKSFKIKFYDFSSGQVSDAADNELPENYYGGIAASADGTVFLYARQDQNASSIMLALLGN